MVRARQTQTTEAAQFDSFNNKSREMHRELSVTVRRAMFALLAYSVSCAIIIAQPDVPFILTSSGVKIPVIDVAVNLSAFLIVGPLGLIAITIYLHLFLVKLDRLNGLDEYNKKPFLFNFQDRFSRFLRFLIFYTTPPILMVGFSWKAAVRDEWWRIAMYSMTMVVAFGMFFTYSKPKLKDRQLITIIFLVIGIVALAGMISYLSSEIGKHLTRNLYLKRAQLPKAKLPLVNLMRANLQFANLSGADLRRADLRGADLRGADLSGANFEGAFLENADLRSTILNEHTKFDQKWQIVWELVNGSGTLKDLSEADLSRAILIEADLTDVDLINAKLSNADLSRAYMMGSYLIGADLRGAHLAEVDLSKANLSKADLSRANLKGADLNEANLSKARFYEAYLRGADLSGASNLTANQLCEADNLVEALLSTEIEEQIESECPDILKKWWY